MNQDAALPPETLEGWYALHQMFRVDRAALRALAPDDARAIRDEAAAALDELSAPTHGWTGVVDLVGSEADVMLVHFRPTLDALTDAQRRLTRAALYDDLVPVYSFLSVTEAGMYHLTAKLAREAAARGGKVGDAEYAAALERNLAAERASEHVQKRLYPRPPHGMSYVSFYPMDKKRETGQNWYSLPIDDRSRLMQAHGLTGRKYAGKVFQVITGAIGLDAWEWGVTLFAADPLEFKKIVSEMRFDEASAKYGEFGEFFVGKLQPPGAWLASVFDREGR